MSESREQIVSQQLERMLKAANRDLPFGIKRVRIAEENGKKRIVLDVHWWYLPIYKIETVLYKRRLKGHEWCEEVQDE